MTQKIFQVDAFTAEPYRGNPAGVCILPEEKDEQWMQAVAREMNVAETAFLVRDANDEDNFHLRWFTPTVEIALCGHATLASAHVLWEEGIVRDEAKISFQTRRSGVLTAVRAGEWIEMDFPAEPATQQTSYPMELRDALKVEPRYVGQNRFDFIVEVENEKILRSIEPDMRLLCALDVRGVIVTSRAEDSKYDFVSRFFAPGAGVDEDHATGSAHCCLAPFWQERLGRAEMLGYQASPRGAEVRVRVVGERVLLGGQAVTVLRGELLFS
ncbi:MAG: PhzF family phenazine biosynthesis protein [Pyrinomonadaceae bacterium]|nr:PhzF family phenazine biosynthesis protein [Pyrinomonadaceae bacterium]